MNVSIHMLLLIAALISSPRTDSVVHAFTLFQKADNVSLKRKDLAYNSNARARYINAQYEKYIGIYQNKEALSELSTHDVNLLWHAALEAYSAGNNKSRLHEAEMDVSELRKRGKVTPLVRNYMVKSYIQDRDFQQANKTLKSSAYRGSLLPGIKYAQNYDRRLPSIMMATKDMSRVRVENVDLKKYSVVVVATPQCHFVSHAMSDIGDDKSLREVFSRSLWIMPQDGNYDPAFMRRWNRTHGIMKMAPVFNERSWPMITYWGTPTFYFLYDGKVVRRVVGWPEGGNKKALLEAFHEYRN